MAIQKATTTADLTDTAKDAGPTREEQVQRTVELTDPGVLADVKAPKTVKVTAPFTGTVTEVPESIVDALLASGYSKSK